MTPSTESTARVELRTGRCLRPSTGSWSVIQVRIFSEQRANISGYGHHSADNAPSYEVHGPLRPRQAESGGSMSASRGCPRPRRARCRCGRGRAAAARTPDGRGPAKVVRRTRSTGAIADRAGYVSYLRKLLRTLLKAAFLHLNFFDTISIYQPSFPRKIAFQPRM